MRVLWVLVALFVLVPIASAQAAPPTCTSFFRAAEDDGRPTGGSVGCRGPLDVPLKTEIVSRPAHGTLTDIEDRTWPWGSSSDVPRYTPTAGYRGPDSFTIRATVAGESVEHVVKIDVIEAVDDPPACNFNWANVVIAPGPVPLDAGETGYGNVACGDDEGATLAIAVESPPEHGVLGALEPLGGFFQGARFTLRPNASYRGPDRFTIRASDGTHTILTTAEINVIEPTDAAPMCLGIPYIGPTGPTFQPSVKAGKPIELTFSCGDPEGATLNFAVVIPPAHGTVVLSQPDKMIAYATYTPDVAFRGVDEFTVRMTDGPHVLDRTFKVDVVEPDPVVEEQPAEHKPAEEQPAAEVRSDPPVVTAPPAAVVVSKAVKPVSSPLDQRIAKACGKLKGTRKTACAKRERALAKCGAMKTRTSKQRAAKRACVKRAKRP